MTALYSGNLLDDRNGRPIEGAELWVYDSLGVEAALTDIADQPLTQPLTTDADGAFEYKAIDGVYRHDFWKNSLKIYTDNRVVVGVPAVVDVAVGAFGQTLVANATAADARADLGVNSAAEMAASGGSALVGFLQAGTGAVARTGQDKLRDSVNIKDFGAIGDGTLHTVAEWIIPGALGRFANLAALQVQYPFVTSTSWSIDRTAIQAAHNASKSVYYPSGTYHMGDYSTADTMVDLSELGAGVSIQTDKSVELICNTTATVEPVFYYLENNSNFRCGHIRFMDSGYNSALTWRGATGFRFDSVVGATGNWGDIAIEGIYAKNLVAPVKFVGGNATNRIRGIHIGTLFSNDCYYGYSGQNQGDAVQIDLLYAYLNIRPLFVYGVSGVRAKVFNRKNRGGSGAINISRSVGGFNTTDIDIHYTAREQDQGITHVLINHIDLLGGSISNIKVHVDIESSAVYTPVRFVNYTGSGGSETSSSSSNEVFDIQLSGTCDGNASAITAVASYNSKRNLTFTRGQNLTLDPIMLSKFYLGQTSQNQSVTWTGSGSNPAIGNGTLRADYVISGGLCTCSITLTVGSTTTFGIGEWAFGLAYTSFANAAGAVYMLDSGTAFYSGVCKINAGSSNVAMFADGAGSGFTSGSPFTWATGDQIVATLSFPIG